MHARTVPLARRYQLARVVAVRAADDDDDVAAVREVVRGGLALFRRMADGVDEVNV